jgi:ribose-phosphate pyrophosphokinase
MDFEIVSVSAQINLAQNLANRFEKKIYIPFINHFSDGELEVVFESSITFDNKKIFILQSTCQPVQDNIIQFALLAHAVKNLNACDIIGIIPYFGYSRHDKSKMPGKQGEASIIAKLIEATGIKQLITVEPHSQVLKNLFSIPVKTVSTINLIVEHIQKNFADVIQDICMVAPDKGGKERAQAIAQQLKVSNIFFTKERYALDKTRIIGSKNECTGHTAIIVDDIIDTAGTALNTCDQLKKFGFKKIYGYFIHPVLSDSALEKINESSFEKIFVSNTIPLQQQSSKIEVLDISALLAQAIE